MTYKLLMNSSGIPAGYLFDESGEYTEQQAKDAVLCGKPNPTQSDVDSAKEARALSDAATEYRRHRAMEYPPIGDQLDALWKGGDAAAAMLAKVQAVKTKYPKPE
jgi:hypothetical protein